MADIQVCDLKCGWDTDFRGHKIYFISFQIHNLNESQIKYFRRKKKNERKRIIIHSSLESVSLAVFALDSFLCSRARFNSSHTVSKLIFCCCYFFRNWLPRMLYCSAITLKHVTTIYHRLDSSHVCFAQLKRHQTQKPNYTNII